MASVLLVNTVNIFDSISENKQDPFLLNNCQQHLTRRMFCCGQRHIGLSDFTLSICLCCQVRKLPLISINILIKRCPLQQPNSHLFSKATFQSKISSLFNLQKNKSMYFSVTCKDFQKQNQQSLSITTETKLQINLYYFTRPTIKTLVSQQRADKMVRASYLGYKICHVGLCISTIIGNVKVGLKCKFRQ